MRSTYVRFSSDKALAILLSSASASVLCGTAIAQTHDAPVEEVLVTGSLITGGAAIGVPVTSLSAQDYLETGSVTTAELLKSLPSVQVVAALVSSNAGANGDLVQPIALHGIGGGTSAEPPKTLLLVNGRRFPIQGHNADRVDPSIVPPLALQRLDILADGASATYGSNAIAGVINVVLKRGFDGAISQFSAGQSTDIGGFRIESGQQYGRTWDGGDITLTYDYYHTAKIEGPARPYVTLDYTPWGLDDVTFINATAGAGIVSIGKPALPPGAPAGFNASIGPHCANCYSIPKGQNGVGLQWSAILANPGEGNLENPYSHSWLTPDVASSAMAVTFDQNITSWAHFYFNGFYLNRRSIQKSDGNELTTGPTGGTFAVPTTNPYYPIGAPPGLQVSYNFDNEFMQERLTGVSIASQWEPGINFDLPYDWKGQIFYAGTQDHDFNNEPGGLSKTLASAALGNTVPASPGAYAAFTKPANVPYFNIFCDPRTFTDCNSPATYAYIYGTNIMDQKYQSRKTLTDEGGLNFNGPLFDLPAGTLKAAIGLDYYTEDVYSQSDGRTPDGYPSLNETYGFDTVSSLFAQFDVPIIGDANKFPLVQKLDLQLSGRIDHYSIAGVTKNPKVALDWGVGGGLILHATWGTSFRAPGFGDTLGGSGNGFTPINVAAGATPGGPSSNIPVCPVLGVDANPGTAAADLNPHCTAALNFPGGAELGGGATPAAPARNGVELQPETAHTWALGFDYAPEDNFLKGFSANATLWYIKINGTIQSFPADQGLDDPLGIGHYLTPANTPDFDAVVQALGKNYPANTLIPTAVQFIADDAIANLGSHEYKGIDFQSRYDLDLGDQGLGAWEAGVTGTFYLLNKTITISGQPVSDFYSGNSGGRLDYRLHLGWIGGEDDAWSVTGFMNYMHHKTYKLDFRDLVASVPPSCFLIGNTPCNASGGLFSQYTQQFPSTANLEPAFVTFDMSMSYKTGTRPANDYLKNISVQLTVSDLLNHKPNFVYYVTRALGTGGTAIAFDPSQSVMQRYVTVAITKGW